MIGTPFLSSIMPRRGTVKHFSDALQNHCVVEQSLDQLQQIATNCIAAHGSHFGTVTFDGFSWRNWFTIRNVSPGNRLSPRCTWAWVTATMSFKRPVKLVNLLLRQQKNIHYLVWIVGKSTNYPANYTAIENARSPAQSLLPDAIEGHYWRRHTTTFLRAQLHNLQIIALQFPHSHFAFHQAQFGKLQNTKREIAKWNRKLQRKMLPIQRKNIDFEALCVSPNTWRWSKSFPFVVTRTISLHMFFLSDMCILYYNVWTHFVWLFLPSGCNNFLSPLHSLVALLLKLANKISRWHFCFCFALFFGYRIPSYLCLWQSTNIVTQTDSDQRVRRRHRLNLIYDTNILDQPTKVRLLEKTL